MLSRKLLERLRGDVYELLVEFESCRLNCADYLDTLPEGDSDVLRSIHCHVSDINQYMDSDAPWDECNIGPPTANY